MVSCGVVGCSNRSSRDHGIGYFRFPIRNPRKKYVSQEKTDLIRLRRNMWIMKLGRQDLFDDEKRVDGSRVCSKHFVKGKPAKLEEINDIDWVPSLYLGHDFFKNGGGSIKRIRKKYERKKHISSNEDEMEKNHIKDSMKIEKEKKSDSNVTIIYLKTVS